MTDPQPAWGVFLKEDPDTCLAVFIKPENAHAMINRQPLSSFYFVAPVGKVYDWRDKP